MSTKLVPSLVTSEGGIQGVDALQSPISDIVFQEQIICPITFTPSNLQAWLAIVQALTNIDGQPAALPINLSLPLALINRKIYTYLHIVPISVTSFWEIYGEIQFFRQGVLVGRLPVAIRPEKIGGVYLNPASFSSMKTSQITSIGSGSTAAAADAYQLALSWMYYFAKISDWTTGNDTTWDGFNETSPLNLPPSRFQGAADTVRFFKIRSTNIGLYRLFVAVIST
jgi:hypothetical protein